MQAKDKEDETLRLFEEAAERLAAKRQLERMSIDERIIRSLQIYMQEWKEDLDQRPPEAANTTIGLQVCLRFMSRQHPAWLHSPESHTPVHQACDMDGWRWT